jgi:hypothetical protein
MPWLARPPLRMRRLPVPETWSQLAHGAIVVDVVNVNGHADELLLRAEGLAVPPGSFTGSRATRAETSCFELGNLPVRPADQLGKPPGCPRPLPPVRCADGRFAPPPDPLHRSAGYARGRLLRSGRHWARTSDRGACRATQLVLHAGLTRRSPSRDETRSLSCLAVPEAKPSDLVGEPRCTFRIGLHCGSSVTLRFTRTVVGPVRGRSLTAAFVSFAQPGCF